MENATEAARKLDRIVSAEELQEGLTTLSKFEELLCKPLETSLAAIYKSEPANSVSGASADASAALWLAADYLEHAAETLERARQMALDSANRLSKEVPAKVAAWRGELQSKSVVKANPAVSGGSSSWLSWSKKAPAAVASKKQANMLSSEESQKLMGEEGPKKVGS